MECKMNLFFASLWKLQVESSVDELPTLSTDQNHKNLLDFPAFLPLSSLFLDMSDTSPSIY
jgi:hypothetical protein